MLARGLLVGVLIVVAVAGASAQPRAPTDDCANPSRSNYSMQLAEETDLVVSGLAVSMGPASTACVPAGAKTAGSTTGPDLLVQEGDQADGSQVMLFWVQCVHKGAVVCRRNEEDDLATPPRCLIAVKVPQQTKVDGEMEPCTVTRGFRYTMLLSSSAVATCDGVYEMQYPKITESVRTHIGVQYCAPYPSWPSQDTQINGTGLANLLGQACPSSTAGKATQCTGDANPCTGRAACPEDSAVTCVPKACASKTMVDAFVTSAEPCQPLFFSAVTGLPVSNCGITSQRLARQARQAEKRLSTGAAGTASGDAGSTQGQSAPMRLGSVLGGGSRLGPMPVLSDGAAAETNSP